MGRGPKPAKGNARPAVPRKSRKNGDSEVRDLEKRLAETLAQLQTREGELAEAREQATAAQGRADASQEQQAATAEILRVMRQSPIEIQPVFSAIAESAVRLTGAVVATVYEFDGSLVHLRGWAAPPDYPYMDYFRRQFPRAPAREFAAGWVILERALLHRADLQNDPNTPELTREWARQMDLRSVLWVPMLREGEPIGVIGAVRREAGIFSDDEVRLLQTFADQAVVAIENVRLFTELQEKNRALSESLEQQTATSEVLRVISSSPTDVQPVFDAIVGSAVRLCGGLWGTLYRRYDDMVDSSHPGMSQRRSATRCAMGSPGRWGREPHRTSTGPSSRAWWRPSGMSRRIQSCRRGCERSVGSTSCAAW
jgi:GAF domain-containing protein